MQEVSEHKQVVNKMAKFSKVTEHIVSEFYAFQVGLL